MQKIVAATVVILVTATAVVANTIDWSQFAPKAKPKQATAEAQPRAKGVPAPVVDGLPGMDKFQKGGVELSLSGNDGAPVAPTQPPVLTPTAKGAPATTPRQVRGPYYGRSPYPVRPAAASQPATTPYTPTPSQGGSVARELSRSPLITGQPVESRVADGAPPVTSGPAASPGFGSNIPEGTGVSPVHPPKAISAADSVTTAREMTPATKTAPTQTEQPAQSATPVETTAAPPKEAAISQAAFKGIEPGATTLEALKKNWGQPDREEGLQQGMSLLTYKMKPFKQVNVTVTEGIVTTIIVHLGESLSPGGVARQLHLQNIRPVPVPNSVGELLGQSYPERGVTFSFETGRDKPLVSRIVVEPINADPFVLRAEFDQTGNYEQNLKDLNNALKLDPQCGRAYWRQSRLLCELGRIDEALATAEAAVRCDATSAQFILNHALLLDAFGKTDQATKYIETILKVKNQPAEILARTALLQGRILARTNDNKQLREAMKYQLNAIKIATPLMKDKQFALRREAKRIVFDAQMEVARTIASGNWPKKDEVAPKWIDSADNLAQDIVKNDGGSPALYMVVLTETLDIYSRMPKSLDPTSATAHVEQMAKQLTSASQDKWYRSKVAWDTAAALTGALRIHRDRGNADKAFACAHSAVNWMDTAAKEMALTGDQSYMRARLCFLIGSVHAIQRQQHKEAIVWYEKAAKEIAGSQSRFAQTDIRSRGEWLVSMGVSYWETGDRRYATTLTREGISLLENAVQSEVADASVLEVPYSNLSGMFKAQQDLVGAKEFSDKAIQIRTAREGVTAPTETLQR